MEELTSQPMAAEKQKNNQKLRKKRTDDCLLVVSG